MATRKEKLKKKWAARFDYPVDYNDHFETPLVAYQDLLPLLDAVQKGSNKKERKSHVLYDPYYCNGRTAVYLNQLGFESVVHAKRDFYKDIAAQQVPQHDTLITNPPYSDTHKEKCLEFCAQQFRSRKRPFFLLMPNYVAARSYYRRILGDLVNDVAYLIPSSPYEYDHPEGTGHEIPPFASLWFCGVGRDQIQLFQQIHAGSATFVPSLEELEAKRAIPTEKRPNPRQRKKRKAAILAGQTSGSNSGTHSGNASLKSTEATKRSQAQKASRYRDESGKRVKKRF